MAKGKDFMRRNIQLPNEYYRNAEDYYRNFYPLKRKEATITSRETENAFEDFKKIKPNAYALLCELFGNDRLSKCSSTSI